jgi:hypothetical protein
LINLFVKSLRINSKPNKLFNTDGEVYMWSISSRIALLALSFGVIVTSAQADVLTTFVVNANCMDCAQSAERNSFPVAGTLTLSDYTAGEELTDANFVSFVYGGSNLIGPYSVTNAGNDGNAQTTDLTFSAISGVLGAIRASYDVEIFFQQTGPFTDFDPIFNFSTAASGAFDTCTPATADACFFGIPGDFGNNAVWNLVSLPGQVPLPGSIALLMAGLVVWAGNKRRQV